MSFRRRFGLAVLTAFPFWISSAEAARLASACTLSATDQNARVEGTNPDKRLPIASVSKVVTTWWGISSKGADYRFPTALHVTPVDDDLYDVHIEGSRDPYFGRESLHVAISELNKRGIKKIRHLTFDENFKFYWTVTAESVAIGHYQTSSPNTATVASQLRSRRSLLDGYADTARSLQKSGFTLTAKPVFSVRDISFKAKSSAQDTPETKVYLMKSAQLKSLVKEMNRNSNNHAANQIFEHLGGAGKFRNAVASKLKLDDEDIRFINGSGDRLDVDGRGRYNEASCSAIVKILRDLRTELKKSKLDLDDVMAVAGRDLSSTTSRMYTNDQTDGALIGKTGTVNPDITLAGFVSTKEGDQYFMYNISTSGGGDWGAARGIIRQKITDLIRAHGGGEAVDYDGVKAFISVDKESRFSEQSNDGAQP